MYPYPCFYFHPVPRKINFHWNRGTVSVYKPDSSDKAVVLKKTDNFCEAEIHDSQIAVCELPGIIVIKDACTGIFLH